VSGSISPRGEIDPDTNLTPLGIASTNVTRSILGITGFCSYIYNFTVDGPNAQNGPFNWQGCMLMR
jgi:hypothetical protein